MSALSKSAPLDLCWIIYSARVPLFEDDAKELKERISSLFQEVVLVPIRYVQDLNTKPPRPLDALILQFPPNLMGICLKDKATREEEIYTASNLSLKPGINHLAKDASILLLSPEAGRPVRYAHFAQELATRLQRRVFAPASYFKTNQLSFHFSPLHRQIGVQTPTQTFQTFETPQVQSRDEQYFQKQLLQANTQELFQLGLAYLSLQESEKAKKCFLQAAKQGCVDSHYNLGKIYEENNPSLAKYHYKIGAQEEDPEAIYNLATLHQKERNYPSALTLYLPLVRKNHIDAIYNAALCYEALEKPSLAFLFFRKGADLGDAQAQFNTARCFERGKGVDPNPEQARIYYQKALSQGIAEASEALARLS